jgi:divalent metal cation (Fe/Co/Zn/Cd) transporter
MPSLPLAAAPNKQRNASASLPRRHPDPRDTYGFGRAEDLAGLVIVVLIAALATTAAYVAIDRLLDPHELSHLPAVAIAAVVGFLSNEWMARFRIRTGRRIHRRRR